MNEIDQFILDVGTIIHKGIENGIDPFIIIGFLETTKTSLVNNLLGVSNVGQ